MKMTEGGFNIIRNSLGKLSQSQVSEINYIVGEMDKDKSITYPQGAYILATTWHETAATMLPITEFGNRKYFDKYDTGTLAKRLGNTQALDDDGFLYRGRGYVQITGKDNYIRVGKLIGVNLIVEPDLALNKTYAIKIMLGGMKNGWFTGKKLSDYIGKSNADYVNARRIINGTDKAIQIARYATIFEKALRSY